MTKAITRDPIYRRRKFPSETIELCVRWYITYRLSYRDLVAMMAERGINVAHTTILRWVLRYVPEFEKRWARHARPVQSSWRMDETAVPVRGRHRRHHYLYRAVDKHGKSVESLLCTDRSIDSAQAFFRKAVVTHQDCPRKVNIDGNAASLKALRLLGAEDARWQSVIVRTRRYLNNIVEQDHRAIKHRCAAMLGLKSFRTAAITLAGVELAHRIRKRQYVLGRGRPRRSLSLKHLWDLALSRSGNRRCTRTQRRHEHRRWSLKQIPVKPVWNHVVRRPLTKTRLARVKPRRAPRRLSDTGGLYLLVVPTGDRYWRFKYRFEGKCRQFSLGTFPLVTLERARARHREARRLLGTGIDPSLCRREIREGVVGAAPRGGALQYQAK